MPEQIVCRKCGSVDDYSTEMKANNLVATCNTCKSFIKNIPHGVPTFYVGKYKGAPISQVEDVSYLKWAYENMNTLSGSQRQAVHERWIALSEMLR